MPFSFPSSPTVGTTSVQNGRTYVWTGLAWELSSPTFTVSPSAPTGGNPGDVWVQTSSTGQVTPSTINSDTNNYNPASGDIYRISSSGAYNITGWTAWADGSIKRVVNVGVYTITFKHQSLLSSDNNRIITPTASDYSLAAGASLSIYWDATDSRVRII